MAEHGKTIKRRTVGELSQIIEVNLPLILQSLIMGQGNKKDEDWKEYQALHGLLYNISD
jgi:hypothetical protein